MIEATALCKGFGDFTALTELSLQIPKGSIYGLIGSNGAGKSTLLRLLAGVYQPNGGDVTLGGASPWENTGVKSRLFFFPDVLCFGPTATLLSLRQFYAPLYPNWDQAFFQQLYGEFRLDLKKRLCTMSKGMQRQAMLCCALATRPQYLLLDEVFDGLDPLVRKKLRGLLAAEVADRQMTVVISTHNLRELEDFCDHLALLHEGRLCLQAELDRLRETTHRVQAVFPEGIPADLEEHLEIISQQDTGLMATLTLRGQLPEIFAELKHQGATALEAISLSLEELFISEMEAAGYDLS